MLSVVVVLLTVFATLRYNVGFQDYDAYVNAYQDVVKNGLDYSKYTTDAAIFEPGFIITYYNICVNHFCENYKLYFMKSQLKVIYFLSTFYQQVINIVINVAIAVFSKYKHSFPLIHSPYYYYYGYLILLYYI